MVVSILNLCISDYGLRAQQNSLVRNTVFRHARRTKSSKSIGKTVLEVPEPIIPLFFKTIPVITFEKVWS